MFNSGGAGVQPSTAQVFNASDICIQEQKDLNPRHPVLEQGKRLFENPRNPTVLAVVRGNSSDVSATKLFAKMIDHSSRKCKQKNIL